MLAVLGPSQFDALASRLPFLGRLPAGTTDALAESCEATAILGEERRFARRPLRMRAVLGILEPAPFRDEAFRYAGVFTRNLSRNGIGFWIHRQLYPAEEVRLFLPSHTFEGVVARCRKLGDACYEVGATIRRSRRAESEEL
jgi:hypothetical protein